jgi:hypothetical protein
MREPLPALARLCAAPLTQCRMSICGEASQSKKGTAPVDRSPGMTRRAAISMELRDDFSQSCVRFAHAAPTWLS